MNTRIKIIILLFILVLIVLIIGNYINIVLSHNLINKDTFTADRNNISILIEVDKKKTFCCRFGNW